MDQSIVPIASYFGALSHRMQYVLCALSDTPQDVRLLSQLPLHHCTRQASQHQLQRSPSRHTSHPSIPSTSSSARSHTHSTLSLRRQVLPRSQILSGTLFPHLLHTRLFNLKPSFPSFQGSRSVPRKPLIFQSYNERHMGPGIRN